MPSSVYILAACQALMMSSTTLMVTASALVGVAMAEEPSLATLPFALQLVATMLTTIPASLLMGRYGRKAGFLLAAAIGIAGGVLAVEAILNHAFWDFVVAAMLIGIFNGFGSYYRFAAAECVPEEKRSRAISYVMVGGVVAAVIGPNLANFGQYLISDARFAGSFGFVILLYGLALLLLTLSDFEQPAINHPTTAGRPLKTILQQPRTRVAILCAMLGYGVMSLIMTATPLAMEHHHHPFDETAFVIQWHVLGMFLPSFFTGQLIERWGVVRILWIGALLGGATITINLLGYSFWHFLLALMLLGVSWNFLFIGGTSLLTETYSEEERSKVQAANDFLVYSTTAIASLSAGYLIHQLGWWWVNIAVIPLIAIILSAIYLLMRTTSIPQQSSTHH